MNGRSALQMVILLLSFSLLLFACQTNEGMNAENEEQEAQDKQPSNEELEPDAEVSEADENSTNEVELDEEPSTDQAETGSQDSQTEVEEPIQPRFAVNPNHYRIEPVLEEGEEYDEKIVLLTFDDTPTGEATNEILDLLDEYEAKAIFFVNGHYAERNVDTLKEIYERGHMIGNHTWWHIYIRQEEPETVREEIVRLNDFIEETLGERPIYFRPPFGQNSDVSLQIIKEEEMQTMNWSNGSLDWEFTYPDDIADQVLSNISSGDNILFHDKQATAEALALILEELHSEGYQFVLPTEVILPEGKLGG